jgi:hypothetical protein
MPGSGRGRLPVSDKTIFTRFVPPVSADAATGIWKDYYRKWEAMTLGNVIAGSSTSCPDSPDSSLSPARLTRRHSRPESMADCMEPCRMSG